MILAAIGEPDWGRIILWGGVVVLSFVVFALVVFILRRRLREPGGSSADIFDLHELQAMRDRGDINEVEYKALRSRAVEALMMQGDKHGPS